ncbi:MAG TPA: hypothetical protein V6C84_26235 [Coleofasciculaceae cyanobacterium]|jgi:hypothetical protein
MRLTFLEQGYSLFKKSTAQFSKSPLGQSVWRSGAAKIGSVPSDRYFI